MIDLSFGKFVEVHYLDKGSSPLPAEYGSSIQPGEYYLQDEEGRIYSVRDVSINDFYGDLQLSDSGDLALVEGDRQDQQHMLTRVRSSKSDWPYHPWIGGNLEELKGLPNTRETANKGVRMIVDTLTHDDRFAGRSIEVIPVPTAPDQITFFVFMDGELSLGPIDASL